jgi:Tol biopolymer transport system component
MHAKCSGKPSAREAVLVMKGSIVKTLADVTDVAHPRTICSFTGLWQPQLVTSTEISWSASQRAPGTPGPSMIVTLDVFSGTTAVVASWQGGGLLDGLHAWSPDGGLLAYLTSDTNGVNLHLLSGGGDRVVANLGAVPARGTNPSEDDAYLDFSPDGAYFALEQTFTGSGAQLQVRKATNGDLAYSQPAATMATWGSTGSKLYFRHPGAAVIYAWDPVALLTQPIGQSLAWIKPRADSGDDYLAFTVRDAAGTPHVWIYGHGGRSGSQLANVRSSPVFLTASVIFDLEEASCGVNCGPGPATQPTGRTFTFDIGRQVESASTILSVISTWPRPGQV